MKTIKTIAVSSLLLLAVGVQAQINIPVNALGSVNTPYSATLTLNGQSMTGIQVDPFTINAALVTTTPSDPAEITAISRTAIWFCMDPLQYIYQNTSKPLIYQSTDPADFNKYDDSSLLPGHGGGLNTNEISAIKALFTQNYIAATQNTTLGLEKAAALQLAIWEVANENNGSTTPTAYNLSSGLFTITNVKLNGNTDANNSGSYTNLITMANAMLTAIPSAGPFTGSLDFLIDGKQTSSNGYSTYQVQDLVGWDPPSPIPESSNFATGALGLLGLAALVKLRRQKSKAAV